MRRAPASLGLFALVSLIAAGCAVADPDEQEETEQPEKVGQKEQPILGGSPDSGNGAVVYLEGNTGACSGTIIAKNGSYGYVLTAAHCDGMQWIVRDSDLSCTNNCDDVWQVDDQIVHPNWDGDPGNGYDFSLIRFIGADANTPVIPPATNPDGVQVGTVVEHSGFGLTESGPTNLRMHVSTPVDELYSLFLVFDQTGGEGTCSGDSGGPAIYNGKVVGVTSFGDQNCTQFGGSGRVQAVYNNFIAPYINGEVVENCDTCFESAINGQCANAVDACLADENLPCYQLVECFNNCGANDDACINACADAHPTGIDPYLAIFECTYCDACPSLCADECDQVTGGGTTVTTSGMNGPATTTTTGAGGASGSGGANGAGGAGNQGGEGSEGGSTGNGATDGGEEDGCGCATVGAERPSQPWAGLAGLALAASAALRRRRK